MSNLREVDVCLKRIRELEAEAKVHILDGMTQRARAEKAEQRWESCKRMLEDRNDSLSKMMARAEKAEADKFISIRIASELTIERDALQVRVAELEATLKEANATAYDEAIAARHAREREER